MELVYCLYRFENGKLQHSIEDASINNKEMKQNKMLRRILKARGA